MSESDVGLKKAYYIETVFGVVENCCFYMEKLSTFGN